MRFTAVGRPRRGEVSGNTRGACLLLEDGDVFFPTSTGREEGAPRDLGRKSGHRCSPSPTLLGKSVWADCSVFIPSYSLRRSLSTQLAGIPTGGSSVYLGAVLSATLITTAPEVREQPWKRVHLTTGSLLGWVVIGLVFLECLAKKAGWEMKTYMWTVWEGISHPYLLLATFKCTHKGPVKGVQRQKIIAARCTLEKLSPYFDLHRL